MNVSFRPVGKREREQLAERGVPPARLARTARAPGYGAGTAVLLDGYVVLAFARDGEVVYQDGSDAIPDLVRAARRVWDAVGMLGYDDLDRIRRRGRARPTLDDILKGAST